MKEKLKQLVLRTNILEDGKAKEVKLKYYKDIDGVAVYFADDMKGYRILQFNNEVRDYKIFTISGRLASKIDEKAIRVYVNHMVCYTGTGLNKGLHDIEKDYKIDEMVAHICGYADTIYALNKLKELDIIESDNIEKRVAKLEKSMLRNESTLSEEMISTLFNKAGLLRLSE